MRDRFSIFGTVTRIRKLSTFGNDVKNTQQRPHDGDHLESMGGEVRLLGVKLTPMARTYELDGVSYSRWPVEALSESVPYEGPRSSVVATSLGV